MSLDMSFINEGMKGQRGFDVSDLRDTSNENGRNQHEMGRQWLKEHSSEEDMVMQRIK